MSAVLLATLALAPAAPGAEIAAGAAAPPAPRAGAPAAPRAAKPRKRCEVVVFKRRGKRIRRCRLKRPEPAPPRPAPAPHPSPAVGGPPLPAAMPGPAPAPPATPAPEARPPAQRPAERDPWFLTLHARDVGNGDFRLTPAIGSIPAGTLYLSYKNDDASEHDLRLRGLAPERPEQLIFPSSSTEDLRETELQLAPGRYEFRCGLLGHEEMRQSFVVDA
jgi:hypothetical protein